MRIVHVIRKPLAEKGLAENVLVFGTGSFNIQSSRISTEDILDGGFYNPNRTPRAIEPGGGVGRTVVTHGEFAQPTGRWPANVAIAHLSGCERVGTAKVKGHKGYPNGPGGKSHPYSSDKRSGEVRPEPWEGPADADGNETIDVWACEFECPVANLDAQSGMTSGGTFQLNSATNRTISTRAHHERQPNRTTSVCNYGDTGGASRYFKVFGCE